MKDLTDGQLEIIVRNGKQAESILLRRRTERMVSGLSQKLDSANNRDRRQIYKQIKGSGMYALWDEFHPIDKKLISELLEDGLIIETSDKRGRRIFKVTDKPYPKG